MLGARETVLVRMRPSARHLFWSAVLFVLLSGLVGFVTVQVGQPWNVIVMLGAGIIALAGVVMPVLRWATRSIVITPHRVLLRSGVFVRTTEEIPFARCTGLTVRRSLSQAMARCATIHLRTFAGELGAIHDTPHPRQVADLLRGLIDQQRAVPPA